MVPHKRGKTMLKTDFRDDPGFRESTRPDAPHRSWRVAAMAACAFCAVALFARIMTYPMQHDEQFYISAGVLFDRYPLYSGIGFSHLPNVALLFAGAFALLGDTHYLLIGRLLAFAAWIGTFAALMLIARTYARGTLIGGLMIALLALNPMFLNTTGMTATNNFLPVPFMLFGLYLFLRAADRSEPSPALAFASGFVLAVAAGFKANYLLLLIPFAIAALLVPPAVPLRSRLLRVALPLFVGGIAGGLPSILYALDDPQGFIAHIVNAHRGPQLGYWAAHPDPVDPKVIGIGSKLLLAHRLWLSGVAMLTLVLLLFGSLDAPGRDLARPVMAAVFALTVITGAPLLLPALTGLAKPGGWTGVQVARDGAAIAARVRQRAGDGPVATLSPIHALEGHLPIYPHFALGQFMVRAAPWVPEGERRHYAYFVTPGTIPSLLSAQPPAAILTGMEGDTDAALEAFATERGYQPVPLSLKKAEDAKRVRLYLAR